RISDPDSGDGPQRLTVGVRWARDDRPEALPVRLVVGEARLELVAPLIVEVQRPGLAVDLERVEIRTTDRVPRRLERAQGSARETEDRVHLVVDVDCAG